MVQVSLEEYGEGIYIMGKEDEEDALLEIHWQTVGDTDRTPPNPDESIREWITYSYGNEKNHPKIPNSKVIIEKRHKPLIHKGLSLLEKYDPDWVRTSDPHPVNVLFKIPDIINKLWG